MTKLKKIKKHKKGQHKRQKLPRTVKKSANGNRNAPVYVLSKEFEFFYELRDLILKSSPAEKGRMRERINKLGRIKLAIIAGVFINKEISDPISMDLLIVGDDIERKKLYDFLRSLEAEVGKEIKYVVMDKEEFQYRMAMFDRFVRLLVEGPHEKLINKLGI